MTDRIGQKVKELRGERKAVWLAERTEELGMKISRSAISDLESGKRRSISLAEVFILAAALEVPPALLIFSNFPDGQEEFLPNVKDTAFRASQWLSGELMPDESGRLVEGNRMVIRARDRQHQEESLSYYLKSIQTAENEELRKVWQDQLETAQKTIRMHNRDMRNEGGVVGNGEG